MRCVLILLIILTAVYARGIHDKLAVHSSSETICKAYIKLRRSNEQAVINNTAKLASKEEICQLSNPGGFWAPRSSWISKCLNVVADSVELELAKTTSGIEEADVICKRLKENFRMNKAVKPFQ